MPEAKIIQFPGAARSVEPSAIPERDAGSDERAAVLDEDPELTALVLQAALTANEIGEFLKRIEYVSTTESRRIRAEIVSNYKIEDILELLSESTESDWAVKPAFYAELALQLARLQQYGLEETEEDQPHD